MSESTITHSANGVTCTIEMTADEYLVSTEPLLRMAALSKWATFPRGVSFAVSAVAFFLLVSYVTEIPALCTSPGYGPQYAVVFGVVCLLLLHVFLLYDLRAYFVFCYRLFHRHAIRWRLRRCFGADALCKQTVTFCSDSSIRCTSLHQPAADGPLAVLPKKAHPLRRPVWTFPHDFSKPFRRSPHRFVRAGEPIQSTHFLEG